MTSNREIIWWTHYLIMGLYPEYTKNAYNPVRQKTENVLQKPNSKLKSESHERKALVHVPLLTTCTVQQEEGRFPLHPATVSCPPLPPLRGHLFSHLQPKKSHQHSELSFSSSELLFRTTPSNFPLQKDTLLLQSWDLPMLCHSLLVLNWNSSAIPEQSQFYWMNNLPSLLEGWHNQKLDKRFH